MSPTHESPKEEEEEEEEEKPVVEDSETLECTTAVVKAVMELSNKLPLAKPNEYVDLVKVLVSHHARHTGVVFNTLFWNDVSVSCKISTFSCLILFCALF